jgi:excisionase family DNA binding protein
MHTFDHLWTLEEVAQYLRVSTATVRRWARAGALVSYRPGGRLLFQESEIREFLLKSKEPAK